jgi:hypothetical protein
VGASVESMLAEERGRTRVRRKRWWVWCWDALKGWAERDEEGTLRSRGG